MLLPHCGAAPTGRPLTPQKTELNVTPAEILDKAADYVLEHGMARGAFSCDDGSACAVGAIRIAATTDQYYPLMESLGAQTELARTISNECRDQHFAEGLNTAGWLYIATWNDKVCQDKEELAQMLRLAAKNAEANGC